MLFAVAAFGETATAVHCPAFATVKQKLTCPAAAARLLVVTDAVLASDIDPLRNCSDLAIPAAKLCAHERASIAPDNEPVSIMSIENYQYFVRIVRT